MNIPDLLSACEGAIFGLVELPWPWPPTDSVWMYNVALDGGRLDIASDRHGRIVAELRDNSSKPPLSLTSCPLIVPEPAAMVLCVVWSEKRFEIYANNNLIGNCIQYADTSFQWGPLVKVDVQLAGEVASSVPIQVVGASNFPAAPTVCSAGGFPIQTAASLGANGILGVGLFRQDCGPSCTSGSPPPFYFICPSTGCTPAAVPVSAQLQNPVWMFPQDNNGLAIVLPQVGAAGAVSVQGSMIFGIGTQADNALNGAQAQAADNFGNFTTTFNGVPYPKSYIDSGSDGYFFLDSTTTGLPDCATTADASGFYCPPSPVTLTAITSGPNPNGSGIPVSQNIAFSIANALALIDSPSVAFNNLGGPSPGLFDWGLPFFFGRTVFVGIEGQRSSAGTGPYWAY